MYTGRFVVIILILLALFAPPSPAVAQSPANPLVFLDSPGADGKVVRERLVTCLNLLVRDLNLAGKPLPPIVVLHVSPQVARAAGVEHTAIIANTPEVGPRAYEFWIVGKPTYAEYTAGMYDILEHYFHVQLPQPERKEIMTRVLRVLQNTISAQAASETAADEATPASRP